MFQKIAVPVDLAHISELGSSLKIAGDLASHYGAEVYYISVTPTSPGSIARSPEEYKTKLDAFAQEQATQHGGKVSTRVMTSSDPATDLDDKIVEAIELVGADLVVMATHLPRRLDAFMPANGGKVATHTDASIMLVRP